MQLVISYEVDTCEELILQIFRTEYESAEKWLMGFEKELKIAQEQKQKYFEFYGVNWYTSQFHDSLPEVLELTEWFQISRFGNVLTPIS